MYRRIVGLIVFALFFGLISLPACDFFDRDAENPVGITGGEKDNTDEQEKEEYVRFSNQLLIAELFPIMDSFDTAINSVENSNDKESFLKGLKMLQGEFHRILETNGLKKIKTVGEKFDPNLHEASGEVESDKFPEGIIVEEVRSGYTLNDRLLRPAVVKVSKGGKKNG